MHRPEWKEELLEMLRERSYKEGTFTLASGKESDFFIDCKKTALSGYGHKLVGMGMWSMIEKLHEVKPLDAVAGVELGGCPLASAVAMWAACSVGEALDALYVRKQTKDHGTKALVEGCYPLRARVVLLEDVVTSGGSSLKAVASLREAGCEVVAVLALVDRLEGGREALLNAGLSYRAIYTRNDFIKE